MSGEKFELGDIVTRAGDDEHEVIELADDLITTRCTKPANWINVGETETNLARRYALVRAVGALIGHDLGDEDRRVIKRLDCELCGDEDPAELYPRNPWRCDPYDLKFRRVPFRVDNLDVSKHGERLYDLRVCATCEPIARGVADAEHVRRQKARSAAALAEVFRS